MTPVTATVRARRATYAVVLLFLGCDRVDRSTLTPIGAGWYFHLQSDLPEAGSCS